VVGAVWLAACGNVKSEHTGDLPDAAGTGELPGLHVTETLPANGVAGADVMAPIVVTFNKPLSAVTVSTTSATISGPGGTSIPATVAATDRQLTITPSQRLPGNAFLTATVTTQVQDVAGEALTTDFSWTFTTGYGTTKLYGAQEFTPRDIPPDGVADVFVGGTPPPRILFIKKGTEDRSVVEFDISQFPTDVMTATLSFDSTTLDPGGGSTRIAVYIFDGNGVADLSDFSRTQTLFAEDFGANDANHKTQTYDVTAQIENARTRGIHYLGFLFLAEDTTDRFSLIASTDNPNTGAPQLTVTY